MMYGKNSDWRCWNTTATSSAARRVRMHGLRLSTSFGDQTYVAQFGCVAIMLAGLLALFSVLDVQARTTGLAGRLGAAATTATLAPRGSRPHTRSPSWRPKS